MENKISINIFQDIKVRTVWSVDTEKWYFSVVDIVAVLTEQTDYKISSKLLDNPQKQTKKRRK
jgi:hypothetical protein